MLIAFRQQVPGFAVTFSCHNQRLADTSVAVRTRHWSDYNQHPDMESCDAWQLVHFRMAPLLMCALNPTAESAEAWTEPSLPSAEEYSVLVGSSDAAPPASVLKQLGWADCCRT